MPADVFTLPILPADLDKLVERLWGDDGDGRGVAREAGVDPNWIAAEADREGTLDWDVAPEAPREAFAYAHSADVKYAIVRALSLLADRLELAGLVVDRSAGVRVEGWAAASSRWPDPLSKVRRYRGRYLIRVVDLDPSDPRRDAYDTAVLARQQDRRTPPAPNAKIDRAGWERWQAEHGRAGR